MNLCLALQCPLFVIFCDIYHLADLLPTDSMTSLIPRLSNICPVLSFLREFENSDSALSAKYRCEVFFSWLVVTSQHYGLSFFCMTDLPKVCLPSSASTCSLLQPTEIKTKEQNNERNDSFKL